MQRFILSSWIVYSVTSFNVAIAADLKVNVLGAHDNGEIGCGLFDMPNGFPSTPTLKVLVPASKSTTCLFENITPGNYAVSVMNDLNGNGELDKNILGVPKEPWGVSNNIRPALRAPDFKEALISLEEDTTITVRIE